MTTAIRAGLFLFASLAVGAPLGAQVGSPGLTIMAPREATYVAGRTQLRARVELACTGVAAELTNTRTSVRQQDIHRH